MVRKPVLKMTFTLNLKKFQVTVRVCMHLVSVLCNNNNSRHSLSESLGVGYTSVRLRMLLRVWLRRLRLHISTHSCFLIYINKEQNKFVIRSFSLWTRFFFYYRTIIGTPEIKIKLRGKPISQHSLRVVEAANRKQLVYLFFFILLSFFFLSWFI